MARTLAGEAEIRVTEPPQRSRGRFWTVVVVIALASSLAMAIAGRWAYWRYWPKKLDVSFPQAAPVPVFLRNQLLIESPTGQLLGRVGTFSDELRAYLNFEYLRSLKQVDLNRVFLTATEGKTGPEYRIYLTLDDDYLTATPYLADLKAHRYIADFDLVSTTPGEVDRIRMQTALFIAAYSRPVKSKLETLPPAKLAANVSKFILFKAKTDRRTREQLLPLPSREQASDLAADIIAVAQFYSVPIDFFLGVGAMENNYLEVRGDLEHKVWKRKAQPGDIVLKRRRGRVLVLNYSIGVWQITRETLRYAHQLFLADKRDYSQLPERLCPSKDLDLDKVDSHVLTTYAGLLIRDLLDRF